jgi:hypothetical protein
MAWFLGWLAISVFNSGNSLPGRSSSRHEPMVAMMLSNQSYAAYVSGAFQSGQNDLHSVTLDWTNRSGSTSGVNPYVRSRMN